ncbi:hypothetical protein ERJ75_000719500 [Trypanosoma vivax]|nr:hypothetical protein ERJ75_000719500 [Trypanosoma vivax]
MLFWCHRRGCLLARRHSVQSLKHIAEKLRRIVLLETATEKPLHERYLSGLGSPSSSTSLRVTPAAFQSVDDALEVLRGNSRVPLDCSGNTTSRLSQTSPHPSKVASLSHFMSECQRFRRSIGESRDQQNRLLMRNNFRSFWCEHVDGAFACCAVRGRDFGFIAAHGLADNGLHVCMDSLRLAFDVVVREKCTCSCMDTVLFLHYLARELNFLEGKFMFQSSDGLFERCHSTHQKCEGRLRKARATVASRGGKPTDGKITKEDLLHLRRAAASFGIERIYYFFLRRDAAGQVLGSAEDAIHALEFLTVVKVNEADKCTLSLIQSAKPWRGGRVDQYVLVSLLRHVSSNCKDLKFTSVVHAFRLIRIFLPIVCPLSPSETENLHMSGMEDGIGLPMEQWHEKDTKTAAGSADGESHSNSDGDLGTGWRCEVAAEYHQWRAQHGALDCVLFGLSYGLKRKDGHFVNPLHFVQIVDTLSRLPPYLLSRAARPKPEPERSLCSLQPSGRCVSECNVHSAAGTDTRKQAKGGTQTPEEFWVYLVSKACIFIPILSSSQRRRVCDGLRAAVGRRVRCFNQTSSELLLPMFRELSQYPEDYQVVMFGKHIPHEEGSGDSPG